MPEFIPDFPDGMPDPSRTAGASPGGRLRLADQRGELSSPGSYGATCRANNQPTSTSPRRLERGEVLAACLGAPMTVALVDRGRGQRHVLRCLAYRGGLLLLPLLDAAQHAFG